tara:strand:- start:601 stop:867 length:267 start_codon:yes stop_codon:yes gene_type:complete
MLVVCELIKDLAGVVSFTASCGLNVLDFDDPEKSLTTLRSIFYEGKFDQLEALLRERPMPVVSSDQEANPSLLMPIQALHRFIDQGGQ